jgi:DNA-binding HxlR family transcriptional regulator
MRRSNALAVALEQVGDRWTLLVVASLLDGARRFGDLHARIPGIAPNILSDRLKRLAASGLLAARPYTLRPMRLEYELTAPGRELAGALRLLAQWGAASHQGGEPLRHAACGTPVEARWYCPTCARTVDAPDEDEISYV